LAMEKENEIEREYRKMLRLEELRSKVLDIKSSEFVELLELEKEMAKRGNYTCEILFKPVDSDDSVYITLYPDGKMDVQVLTGGEEYSVSDVDYSKLRDFLLEHEVKKVVFEDIWS